MSKDKKQQEFLIDGNMSDTSPVSLNAPLEDLLGGVEELKKAEEQQAPQQQTYHQPAQEEEDENPYQPVYGRGFISHFNDLRTRGGTLAYKYAEALKEELKEWKNYDPNLDIQIDVIDKTDSSIRGSAKLLYSAVVCSAMSEEGIVFYTLIIQDPKIKDVLSFSDYTSRRMGNAQFNNQYLMNRNASNDAYTPDQCADTVYFGVVGDFLLSKYGSNNPENPTPLINKWAALIYNGKNVSNKDIEDKVKEISLHVYNTVRNGVYSITNDNWDLSLPELNGRSNITGTNYVLNSNANREAGNHTIQDLNGFPIRSDFTVSLNYVERQEKRNMQYGNLGYNGNETPFGNISTLNTGDQVQELTMIHGYIDPIIKVRQSMIDQTVGDRIIKRTKDVIPNVVLTNIATTNTTLGYSLLAIISSFGVITNDKLVGVMNIHTKSNQVGALNIYCDITGESVTTNELKTLDLYTKNKKNPTADDYAANYITAKYIFNAPVVLSIDVPVAGFETSYLSPFSAASSVEAERLVQGLKLIEAGYEASDNTYDQVNISAAMAAFSIVRAANVLTNGNFPLDFPITDIFTGKHMLIPNGYFIEKNTARDIREVDLAYVITESQLNIELINRWSVTNNGSIFNRSNIYDEKADIISRLLPNAVFTGLSARVTFTGKFLDTLYRAVIANGFAPIDNSTIQVPVSSVAYIAGGGVTSNYYDQAGIGSYGNFFTTQGGLTTANGGFSTAGLYNPGQFGAAQYIF